MQQHIFCCCSQVALAGSSGPAFLGQSMGQTQSMSQETMNVVDAEVKDLVERAYRRAKDLMVVNMDALHNLADALIEKETIDGDEAREIIVATGSFVHHLLWNPPPTQTADFP